jgi:hypothetical protein
LDEKNWSALSHELILFMKDENSSDNFDLIDFIENIDQDFFKFDHKINLEISKYLNKIGKIKLAEKYAKNYLQHLIIKKKYFTINHILIDFQEMGILKKELSKYHKAPQIFLGDKEAYKIAYEDLLIQDWHIDYWETPLELLKTKILNIKRWDKEKVKLTYEFILKYQYDYEIFSELYTLIKKDKKVLKIFLQLSKNKKFFYEELPSSTDLNYDSELKIDYDQVAFEIISGKKEIDIHEENKIIKSLSLMDEKELLSKGNDLVIAFRLLEMNTVVIYLCEKLLNTEIEIKQRTSLLFIKFQSLIDQQEEYKAIDLIDLTLNELVLIQDETIAFLYLKAMAYFKLQKDKSAELIIKEIKKIKPSFSIVDYRISKI